LTAFKIDQDYFNSLPPTVQCDLLRRHLAKYANRGFTPNQDFFIEELVEDWEHMLPSVRIHEMQTHEYHITCGKISYLLRDIYRSMGWKSATYNFGISNSSYTHEATLVAIDQKVIFQDAFYNYSLKEGEEALGFFEFLRRIKTGADENYFSSDTTTVSLLMEKSVVNMDTVRCVTGFVGNKIGENQNLETYDFKVDLPLNLHDSCSGFISVLNAELDTVVRFEQLFLHRISSIHGKPLWEQEVDQIINP